MAMMRYAEALNAALREEMQRDPTVFLFGEDVGRYGGVFKVSKGLMEEFGESRVRDTPISEQSLAAMAVTASMTGTKPILEIMFADFLPLTIDALINQYRSINERLLRERNVVARVKISHGAARTMALRAICIEVGAGTILQGSRRIVGGGERGK